jgi:hypothetical protein
LVEFKDIEVEKYLSIKVKNIGLLSINRLMYMQNAVNNVEEKEAVSDDG